MSEEKEGLVFDFENINPGEWFTYPENENTKVCLRVCAGDDLTSIRKQSMKRKVDWKVNPVSKELERKVYIEEADPDGDLFNELLWDFCIVDWAGVLDGKKTPIPCTRENKKFLMGKSVKFSSFVVDCLEKLKLFKTNELEEEIKN
jgi:hypothetical protein